MNVGKECIVERSDRAISEPEHNYVAPFDKFKLASPVPSGGVGGLLELDVSCLTIRAPFIIIAVRIKPEPSVNPRP